MQPKPIPFDQRDGYIWQDGRLVPWKDAKIHVLNHGLHYGSCVFEGERAYGGQIFKALQALQRRLARVARAQGGHASQAAQGVQAGADHAAMHAAMHKVANQLGLHVDAGAHPVGANVADLQAHDTVENNVLFKQLAQQLGEFRR
jgi:hypothetical protein